ncbi:MAG: glycosyltransferase [Leptolyngbya sp. PLA1]|nr:glycosyltransferase [Leptolyngbya sp. PLA1]
MEPGPNATLILHFPHRPSAGDRADSPRLAREWPLLRRLLPLYSRVIVVSTEPGLPERLHSLVGEGSGCAALVVNPNSAGPNAPAPAAIGHMVARACAEDSVVVVRTSGLHNAAVSLAIIAALSGQGTPVGLIARGSYLWSRAVASQFGPHSPEADEAGRLEGELCRRADVVVGTSSDMLQDLSWRYQLHPDRCVMIPRFVTTDIPSVDASERNTGLLVAEGRLIASQQMELLVRGMAMLPTELRERTTLEVVGDGPERAPLERLAASLNAPVRFMGDLHPRDLLTRLCACAIYLQAGEGPGQPAALLEAMASGAPVLVAKGSELDGLVIHGQTGLRLDPTPEAYALAIEEALGDADWRDVLGASAARTIRATCGMEVVAPKELAVHRRVIASVSSARAAA